MANLFLEENLSECVRVGSGYQDEYDVEITQTADGQEIRRLIQPYMRKRFNISYLENRSEFGDLIVNMYRRVYGRFVGFRFKAADDFTTAADGFSAPTAGDQPLTDGAQPAWQMIKVYPGTAAPSVGSPTRVIYKPVAGTVLYGINNPAAGGIVANDADKGYTYDTTTGVLTEDSDSGQNIASIDKNFPCTLTTAGVHGVNFGETVVLKGITGMTELNGLRVRVLTAFSNTMTLDVDTTSYTTYTGSGTALTALDDTQGETPYFGAEFDIPVRFDTQLPVDYLTDVNRTSANVELVEILNP